MELETWNEIKDRPAAVRRNADAIREATGLDLDVPDNLVDVEEWLGRYKGVVTRRLQPDDEGEDEDSDPEEDTE